MSAHSFDGRQTRRGKKRSSTFSQADTFRGITTFDQHGRPMDGVIQIKSGGVSGPLHPKYVAPMYPDPKYVIVNEDNTAEAYIDYPSWARDRRTAEKEHHARALRVSAKKGWPEPKVGQYSEQVEEELGLQPPGKASILVLAMYQENPWIIGACAGCSTRDGRTGEFLPRFSFNCVCIGGYRPYAADPRLEKYLRRPEDELLGESVEDFSIDAYAIATGQSVDEVQQRPTQFRRVKRRGVPLDGPEALGNVAAHATQEDASAVTAALEDNAIGPEMNADEEAELDASIAELETLTDEESMFSGATAASSEDEETEEELDAIERTADPGATGGTTVPPTQQNRAARQAPRQGQASTRRQIGAQRSAQGNKAKRNDGRRSLADGAEPVIGS